MRSYKKVLFLLLCFFYTVESMCSAPSLEDEEDLSGTSGSSLSLRPMVSDEELRVIPRTRKEAVGLLRSTRKEFENIGRHFLVVQEQVTALREDPEVVRLIGREAIERMDRVQQEQRNIAAYFLGCKRSVEPHLGVEERDSKADSSPSSLVIFGEPTSTVAGKGEEEVQAELREQVGGLKAAQVMVGEDFGRSIERLRMIEIGIAEREGKLTSALYSSITQRDRLEAENRELKKEKSALEKAINAMREQERNTDRTVRIIELIINGVVALARVFGCSIS